MLCDNTISSVENGDDHSTFDLMIFFFSESKERPNYHPLSRTVVMLFHTEKIPSEGSSNSW